MGLPGGILHDGARRRDFAFRHLTGAVELALAEAAGAGATLPAKVTAALAAALEHVGGKPPVPETVSGLAVADRQFLMGRLATGLGLGESWLTARCGRCGERFDFSVTHADLPVKEAGEGYPFTTVATSLGPCRFRVPTGADQEFLAGIEDEGEACRSLVGRCLVDFPGEGQPSFTADDMARIESALEAVAPEVAVSVQAACPACGTTHVIDVDPYGALSRNDGGWLLREIHILAATYHWSEGEILALPLERRRRYLELIDRARGMAR
ncbi:hypothetical protein [Geobacter benzoatilyticus]|uniref:Phage baseplate protein n=1 Tax=Geobacter benzoatilyticus TaxID=2815309 RepID=A0ABX7Q3L0_9BACT|nr:hypothetical protein [Geobacter benzoatilyticus]QSV45782.1 hypothetical protein JZM60_00340 [Geobacter benzoatilyticus]